MSRIYHLLWSQCIDTLKAKIKGLDNFVKVKIKFDAINLLKGIQTSILKFESTKYKYILLHQAYAKYLVFKQSKLGNFDYIETYQYQY